MAEEAAVFTIMCCVRGYHVYQCMWTPFIGAIATTVRTRITKVITTRIVTFTFTLHTVLPLHSVEYHV